MKLFVFEAGTCNINPPINSRFSNKTTTFGKVRGFWKDYMRVKYGGMILGLRGRMKGDWLYRY